jgi:hypothetical protein
MTAREPAGWWRPADDRQGTRSLGRCACCCFREKYRPRFPAKTRYASAVASHRADREFLHTARIGHDAQSFEFSAATTLPARDNAGRSGSSRLWTGRRPRSASAVGLDRCQSVCMAPVKIGLGRSSPQAPSPRGGSDYALVIGVPARQVATACSGVPQFRGGGRRT